MIERRGRKANARHPLDQRLMDLVSGLLIAGYSSPSIRRWLQSNGKDLPGNVIRHVLDGRRKTSVRVMRLRLEVESAMRRAEKDRVRAELSSAHAARLHLELAEMEAQ